MQKQPGSRFFITVLLCSLALLLSLFWAYISAIVLALFIASVFYPLYLRVKGLFRDREILSSLFMTLFILLTLILPMGWFASTLSK
jgi:predicted PurR-regulated permease PerM